jgi:hypothetical protein
MAAKQKRRSFRVATLGVVALGAGFACGPSFEAIAEGDLRFAHCDRLDLDPNIAPSHRLHCWREWRRVYTYGQTRDRVEYAQRRIAEVVSGDVDPAFDLPSGTPRPLEPAPRPSSGGAAGSTTPAAPVAPVIPVPLESSAAAPPGCAERCQNEERLCLADCVTRPTGCEPCGTIDESCRQQCESAQ